MSDALARLAEVALESDERTIHRAALQEAMRSLRAPLGQVLVRGADGATLAVRASRGWGRGEAARSDLPAGRGSQAGFALEAGVPVLVEDMRREPRFEPAEAERGRDVRSGASCAIAGAPTAVGVIQVHSPEPGAFDAEHADRLRSIADIVALAVARVRTAERVAELAEVRGRLVAETVAAEERERKRLAETLHDGAMQSVVTAGYDLDAMLLGDDDTERLRRARTAIGDALRQLRRTVQELHPIVLEAAGLGVALDRLCAEHAERSRAEFALDMDGDAEGAHDRLLFDLARELVGNASRHARASRVEVSVRRRDGDVVLRVADDGRGMRAGSRAAAVRAGHIGLASCAERVDVAGGRLDIESEPGTGTTVTARLPAAPPDAT